MPFDERGELLGHITIGIELVNTLWRKLAATPAAAAWAELQPAGEDVRLHLLHLLLKLKIKLMLPQAQPL